MNTSPESALSAISLADPRLGDLRLSGVYRTADPVGFLNALGALYPLRWREVAPGRYELSAARG